MWAVGPPARLVIGSIIDLGATRTKRCPSQEHEWLEKLWPRHSLHIIEVIYQRLLGIVERHYGRRSLVRGGNRSPPMDASLMHKCFAVEYGVLTNWVCASCGTKSPTWTRPAPQSYSATALRQQARYTP